MTMNAARLDESPRLQRVLDVLSDGRSHTTREIVAAADVCAVNSCVAELRANGVGVSCSQGFERGRRVFRYRLESAA